MDSHFSKALETARFRDSASVALFTSCGKWQNQVSDVFQEAAQRTAVTVKTTTVKDKTGSEEVPRFRNTSVLHVIKTRVSRPTSTAAQFLETWGWLGSYFEL
jgi:hypothetical protein